jgi:excisionase family DNA binding protein
LIFRHPLLPEPVGVLAVPYQATHDTLRIYSRVFRWPQKQRLDARRASRRIVDISRKQYLDITALAEQLRIKRSTLYAWAEQGTIPYLKLGRLVRFDPDEIEAWLEAHRQDATPEPTPLRRRPGTDHVDALIAEAKRTVYTPSQGNQTRQGQSRR